MEIITNKMEIVEYIVSGEGQARMDALIQELIQTKLGDFVVQVS